MLWFFEVLKRHLLSSNRCPPAIIIHTIAITYPFTIVEAGSLNSLLAIEIFISDNYPLHCVAKISPEGNMSHAVGLFPPLTRQPTNATILRRFSGERRSYSIP